MVKLLVFLLLINILRESSSNITYPYTCDTTNRPSVCTADYVGVCGWFDDKTPCLSYPCAFNSSNSCTACSMANVANVTLGSCPWKPPTTSVGNFLRFSIFSLLGLSIFGLL